MPTQKQACGTSHIVFTYYDHTNHDKKATITQIMRKSGWTTQDVTSILQNKIIILDQLNHTMQNTKKTRMDDQLLLLTSQAQQGQWVAASMVAVSNGWPLAGGVSGQP